MTFSVNKAILAGRLSDHGPKLTWNAQGKPELSFTLIVEKPYGDRVFKSFIPVTVYGDKAESLAERLEAGDLLLVEGEIGYKSAKDGKGGLVIVGFSVQVLQGAEVGA